jgi:hypothetical protein
MENLLLFTDAKRRGGAQPLNTVEGFTFLIRRFGKVKEPTN